MSKQVGFTLLLILFCLIAGLFADTTIPLIGKIIELKINIVGFFIEPLLQWAFDMPLRQAQIVAAWVYLLMATLVTWYVFLKIYSKLINWFETARHVWKTKNRWQKVRAMLFGLISIGLLVKLGLIFA